MDVQSLFYLSKLYSVECECNIVAMYHLSSANTMIDNVILGKLVISIVLTFKIQSNKVKTNLTLFVHG